MRKILALFLITTGSICLLGAPSGANDNPQVCSGTHITPVGNQTSITVTAPDDQLISAYCVKAGSLKQGNGPVYVIVDPPAKTVTITHPSGKDISHYTVTFVNAFGGTTTTTVEPTTTTTIVDESTTTTAVPNETTTTTVITPDEPTTTVGEPQVIPPVVITRTPTAHQVSELPATGANSTAMLALGVGMILSGVALTTKSKRTLG